MNVINRVSKFNLTRNSERCDLERSLLSHTSVLTIHEGLETERRGARLSMFRSLFKGLVPLSELLPDSNRTASSEKLVVALIASIFCGELHRRCYPAALLVASSDFCRG